MQTCWKDLTDPTAVDAAVYCEFTGRGRRNLIVAKSSLVQIFDVFDEEREIAVEEETEREDVVLPGRGENEEQGFLNDVHLLRSRQDRISSLVLVAEFHLDGTITSLATIRTISPTTPGAESLLISFRDAKVSLVEWDAANCKLQTVSLHYYEQESHQQPFAPRGDETDSRLYVDATGRCATLNFYRDMLAIIPFRQEDDDLLDDAPDGEQQSDKPYLSSFVLHVSTLDEALSNITAMTFLRGYREPTLALLYTPHRTATSLLEHRKDTSIVSVITLDISSRASSTIYTINNLPYDIHSVLALPTPVGGLLCIGANSLVYIDSQGRTSALAVNGYAVETSNFTFVDESTHSLRLDGAVAVPLGGPDVLVVTRQGHLWKLIMEMDGARVVKMHLEKAVVTGDLSRFSGASCAVQVGDSNVFLGSRVSDSILLGWNRKGEVKSEKLAVKAEIKDEDEDDDLDNLYGDSSSNPAQEKKAQKGEHVFSLHDSLTNCGPILDFTVGEPLFADPSQARRQAGISPELELVCATGSDASGALTVMRKSVMPIVEMGLEFKGVRGLWTLKAADGSDNYLVIGGEETSMVYDASQGLDAVEGSDWETEERTIAVGTVMGGLGIVQVGENVLRLFDTRLKLMQLVPATEEEGSEDAIVLSAHFTDSYVMVILDNGKLVTFKVNGKSQELVEMKKPEALAKTEVVAGALFASRDPMFDVGADVKKENNGVKATAGKKRKRENDNEEDGLYGNATSAVKNAAGVEIDEKNVSVLAEQNPEGVMRQFSYVVTADGALQVYQLPEYTPVFECPGFGGLPATLVHGEDEAPTEGDEGKVVEILVTDMGDERKEPYLLARTLRNDIVIYKPYEHEGKLRFTKVPCDAVTRQPIHPDTVMDGVEQNEGVDLKQAKAKQMVPFEDVAGYSGVFLQGKAPSWIIKTAKSPVRIHPNASETPAVAFSTFSNPIQEKGYIYADNNGSIRIAALPDSFTFDNKWSSRTVPIGRNVHGVDYHPKSQTYIIATSENIPFELVNEDGEPAVEFDKEGQFLPDTQHGDLCLVSPHTWSVIFRHEFAPNEFALSVKTVDLEISEVTKKRAQYIAVGTGMFRGEDLAMRGTVYLFEVIEVNPEPGKPETNKALRLIWSEEVKGAVSVVCDINGYLLASQGQKVIVRGFDEGNDRLVGVAFVDLHMYVSIAKPLKNMLLFGDIAKSISFVGFSENPYKMTTFGKDSEGLETVAGDFIVKGSALRFVIADGHGNVHIFQYDPESPQSLAGEKLLRRADIHIGHQIKTMKMLPKTLLSRPGGEEGAEQYLCLAGTLSGNLGMVTPISERAYRRLNILQGQIATTEESVAGLNNRAYRLSTHVSRTSNPMRGVIDGSLVSTFVSMSTTRRAEIAKKTGARSERIMDDLLELDRALEYF
ncbi:mRNA cleavage and polyadenylation factor subunit [Saitoella coloradoensis]